MKPTDAARTVTARLLIEPLPFDIKYKLPRTPAAPKNKLIRASA